MPLYDPALFCEPRTAKATPFGGGGGGEGETKPPKHTVEEAVALLKQAVADAGLGTLACVEIDGDFDDTFKAAGVNVFVWQDGSSTDEAAEEPQQADDQEATLRNRRLAQEAEANRLRLMREMYPPMVVTAEEQQKMLQKIRAASLQHLEDAVKYGTSALKINTGPTLDVSEISIEDLWAGVALKRLD